MSATIFVVNLKRLLAAVLMLAGFYTTAQSQTTPLPKYRLHIQYVDKDSTFNPQALKLQNEFTNQPDCINYINQLPGLLNLKGYPAASVDSVGYDSTGAAIRLFLGEQSRWVQLNVDSVNSRALDESGYMAKNFKDKPLDFSSLQGIKERLLNYYEKNGYPFASVFLDSIRLTGNTVTAALKVKQGPLYHIDSIRVIGKAKISRNFLQRYLEIPKGSIYNKEKLDKVSKRLLELPYIQEEQPSELLMLGTGSILNVYLQPKRSSQVNVLIGFLPANNETNKLQLTGDVNLNLKNTLGAGETLLLNWQQLQPKSPRLNLGFQQPYLFKSPFGVDVAFDLFKKDSTFLQLNFVLGVQYLLSSNQSGKLFFQQQSTILLGSGVDTNNIRLTKVLPPNIDVSASNIGIDYDWYKTNYRFNPRSGNEIKLTATVGTKTIKKNNDIISLQDPAFDYNSLYDSIKLKTYQLRAKLIATHYFPAGKRSTVKATLNGGLYQSPSIFRNDLFQVGGYKLLRGFDEESIYATRYAVLTSEYRYLVGLNSYLFAFIDAGLVKNNYQSVNVTNQFFGTGLGLVFETKAGLLNMSFAIGKRDDVNFDLRRASKIHFGYINYF